MNKKQAAEFLGVSVRALEGYVQQGRLTVRYKKGKTRPTANFDETDIIPIDLAEFGDITIVDKFAGMVEMLKVISYSIDLLTLSIYICSYNKK